MELKPIAEFKTCCAGPKPTFSEESAAAPKKIKPTEIAVFVAALAVWWLVYQSLPHLARYLTYDLFGLSEGSHLAAAVEFFIYDTPKVLMLLTIVVFGVGIINSSRAAFWREKKSRWAIFWRRFWGWRRRSAPARPSPSSSVL